MTKTVIKLQELFQLDVEINGFVNQETNERVLTGLLDETISMSTRYWLLELNEKIAVKRGIVNKLREDLIRKHGTEDEQGNVVIPTYINELIDDETKEVVSREINPSYTAFQNEFSELLNEDCELEHHSFQLDEFKNVTTQNRYIVIFKLIQKPTVDA